MPNAVDAVARAGAVQAIQQVGKAETLVRYVDTYNETLMEVVRTATSYTVFVVMKDRWVKGADGLRRHEGQIALLAAADPALLGVTPTKGDRMTVGGTTCTVEDVEIVQPATLPILFKLALRADARGAVAFALAAGGRLLESGDSLLLESGDRHLLEA